MGEGFWSSVAVSIKITSVALVRAEGQRKEGLKGKERRRKDTPYKLLRHIPYQKPQTSNLRSKVEPGCDQLAEHANFYFAAARVKELYHCLHHLRYGRLRRALMGRYGVMERL